MTIHPLVDQLLAEERAKQRLAQAQAAREDGSSAGPSTLAATVYTQPPVPTRCSECQRGRQYYEGCSHTSCPQRRSVTAQPRRTHP